MYFKCVGLDFSSSCFVFCWEIVLGCPLWFWLWWPIKRNFVDFVVKRWRGDFGCLVEGDSIWSDFNFGSIIFYWVFGLKIFGCASCWWFWVVIFCGSPVMIPFGHLQLALAEFGGDSWLDWFRFWGPNCGVLILRNLFDKFGLFHCCFAVNG